MPIRVIARKNCRDREQPKSIWPRPAAAYSRRGMWCFPVLVREVGLALALMLVQPFSGRQPASIFSATCLFVPSQWSPLFFAGINRKIHSSASPVPVFKAQLLAREGFRHTAHSRSPAVDIHFFLAAERIFLTWRAFPLSKKHLAAVHDCVDPPPHIQHPDEAAGPS